MNGWEPGDGYCTCYSIQERALDCGIRAHREEARAQRTGSADPEPPMMRQFDSDGIEITPEWHAWAQRQRHPGPAEPEPGA